MVCSFECPDLISGSEHVATLDPRPVEPILRLHFVPRYRLPYDKFVCALLTLELWDIEQDRDCTLKKKKKKYCIHLISSVIAIQR